MHVQLNPLFLTEIETFRSGSRGDVIDHQRKRMVKVVHFKITPDNHPLMRLQLADDRLHRFALLRRWRDRLRILSVSASAAFVIVQEGFALDCAGIVRDRKGNHDHLSALELLVLHRKDLSAGDNPVPFLCQMDNVLRLSGDRPSQNGRRLLFLLSLLCRFDLAFKNHLLQRLFLFLAPALPDFLNLFLTQLNRLTGDVDVLIKYILDQLNQVFINLLFNHISRSNIVLKQKTEKIPVHLKAGLLKKRNAGLMMSLNTPQDEVLILFRIAEKIAAKRRRANKQRNQNRIEFASQCASDGSVWFLVNEHIRG